MNVKQLFVNVTALKAAVSTARAAAKDEAQRDCGRGTLISRGAHIKTYDAKGELIQGEAESWEFKGTAKQFAELAALLAADNNVAEIEISGGWNWAVNPTAYADCDYDPWVSEWSLSFGTKAEEAAPAAVSVEEQAAQDASDEAFMQWASDAGEVEVAPVEPTPAPAAEAAAEPAYTREDVLAEFKAGCEAIERELATVSAYQWVILWNGLPLKTNGSKVGMFGKHVYCGARWGMERDAARFLAGAVESMGADAGTVVAMPAKDALAQVRAHHARLLAGMKA